MKKQSPTLPLFPDMDSELTSSAEARLASLSHSPVYGKGSPILVEI